MDRLWAVVPAAGLGARLGGTPKQYRRLQGECVLWHALTRLARAPGLQGIMVGLAPGDREWAALSALPARIQTYEGGATRADTVLSGLAALTEASEQDYVLVHDAARPCLARSDLQKLLTTDAREGALLAVPVADTLKQGEAGRVLATVPRDRLWRALTPQLFPVGGLRRALQQARAAGAPVTDEASACERMGWHPALVMGRTDNIKITYSEDLDLAERILQGLEAAGE